MTTTEASSQGEGRAFVRASEAEQAKSALALVDVPEELRDNLALFLRLVRKVLKENDPDLLATFDLLLGDNLAGRKEHIAEHGAEYLDDLDVS